MLALSRSRARSFRPLLLLRGCSIGLACHCRQSFRWIFSEGLQKRRPFSIPEFQRQHWSGVAQRVRPIHRQLTPVLHTSTSVAPSCPKPLAVSPASLRGHEKVSARRLNEKPAAQTSDVTSKSPPCQGRESSSDCGLLPPAFDAIQRQSDQNLWRSHREGGEREWVGG